MGRRKGRPDLKMIGEEEEKRRTGRKGGGGWCSQKVKLHPGLVVAHCTWLRHQYRLAVAHYQTVRHG